MDRITSLGVHYELGAATESVTFSESFCIGSVSRLELVANIGALAVQRIVCYAASGGCILKGEPHGVFGRLSFANCRATTLQFSLVTQQGETIDGDVVRAALD